MHPRWQKSDAPPERLCDGWLASASAMQRNRANHPDSVVLLSFDDLLRDTAGVMRRLATMLAIDFEPVLTSPTFNGRLMLANSSFAVPASGMITEPLSRKSSLPDDENRMIDQTCGPLYEAIRPLVERI
jgi:hypothetical protein